jgi:nicotinate phosphoribosyltransferase
MSALGHLYRDSLSLLTDLYQLTMACAAWKSGLARKEAVFHLSFRRPPFKSGYTVAAGLQTAVELIEGIRFREDDLAYLATLEGADGTPLFERGFLEHLRDLELKVDLDAVPEGTVVFPHEPLLRIQGPIIPCMLLESPLLTVVNFQTLVATKAARICEVAAGRPVLEFGLRRAQGLDGSIHSARAADIGGVAATSNALAGKLFGIPVRGTHAHSWVMLFDDEPAAFRAYADALPHPTLLLVDTYDTLEGVRHAIEIGLSLKARGHRLLGIRLDSGDLAQLAQAARRMLDEAGLTDAAIVATNDLDEHTIASLLQQGAPIAIFGVGTRLATAHDDPALGGVYKLAAIRDPGGPWVERIKLSEQSAKISVPGRLQIRRFEDASGMHADLIYALDAPGEGRELVDPNDPLRTRKVEGPWRDLLQPVLVGGRRVAPVESLETIRERAQAALRQLKPAAKRLLNPDLYPVGLERSLHERRAAAVRRARER